MLTALFGAIVLAPLGQAESRTELSHSDRSRSVVIGSGTVGSDRYRVVAVSSPRADRGAPCIFVRIVGLGGAARGGGTVGDCLTKHYRRSPNRAVLPITYGARHGLLPEAQLVMQGLLANGVKAMRLRYADASGGIHHISVALYRLTRELTRRLGRHETSQFFLAFLPEGTFPAVHRGHRRLTERLARRVFSRMRLTTFDASGAVIRSQSLRAKRYWSFVFLVPPPGYAMPQGAPSPRR